MTQSGRIMAVMATLVALLLVGMALGWLGSSERGVPVVTLVADDRPATTPLRFAKAREPSEPADRVETNGPPIAATNLITDWQDRLESIQRDEGSESDKADRLLQIFPNLPEDGQVEAAELLSNLVGDSDYALLGNLLTNSILPEAVLDVLIADVLNRPNSLKLPKILEVARDPQHPKATEARDLLELFLNDNFDQDWTKWQARIQQWLEDNPD